MKIEASSFTLTRIVTFVPFYTLVNKTMQSVFICEDGLDNWTEVQPEEVSDKPVNVCICSASNTFVFTEMCLNVRHLVLLLTDVIQVGFPC